VDTAFYQPAPDGVKADAGFLIVSALVPYKRVDVAIEACRLVGAPLTIVGQGPEEARLRQMAGPDVTFLGWRADEDIRDLYGRATAVLLPGVEDFGMVPVEAQSSGAPVVAVGEGGACETVIDGVTGVLVAPGDDGAGRLAEGLERVRHLRFDRAAIRANAERFSRQRFMTDFQAAIAAALADKDTAR
jgi:glycosyltransferase involved in cell wall biosynthesis